MHGIQHAVDELDGFFAGELAGQFERFVDDYDRRRVEGHHLVDGEAEDVAVYGGHALDAPVFGMGGDAPIDLGDVGCGAQHQLFEEVVGRRTDGVFLGVKNFIESRQCIRGRLLVDIPQEQDLERALAGTSAGGHWISSRAAGA